MFIENPEVFKSWLSRVLEPLCEADPLALAKYVCALVKKDKPIKELKDVMIDQLDVFLQEQTKPFVELLFKTLENQDYLSSNPPALGAVPEVTREPDAISTNEESSKNIEETKAVDDFRDVAPNVQENEFDDKKNKNAKPLPEVKKDNGNAKQRIVLNRNTKFVAAVVAKPKPAFATEQTLVKVIPDLLEDSLNETLPLKSNKRDRKSDSDKEDRRRRTYRSRSRSRSRSFERAKRLGGPPAGLSRSTWRSRSPLGQRYERRRSRSGSPPSRALRYRNRSPHPGAPAPDGLQQNRSRSRSRERAAANFTARERSDRSSWERERDRNRSNRDRDRFFERDQDRERERERDRGATPTQDSNPGDCTGQSRGTATTVAGVFAPVTKKRCRDFDEMGYCMRGDLCQFDHGVDPVVLDQGSAFSGRMAIPMGGIPPPRPPVGIGEYNPLAPDIWSGNRYGGPPVPMQQLPPLHPHHHPQRELISIPTVRPDDGSGVATGAVLTKGGVPVVMGPMLGAQQFPPQQGGNLPPHLAKRKQDGARIVQRPHVPKMGAGGNCSLELKKVPRGLNDIMHLNNHFSKFGKIVNIQVCYEGDPESALITFSSHTEANVAYKSTEAVLNNRFIKVFWHNADNKQENVPPGQRAPIKERLNITTSLNAGNHVTHNKVLINKENMKITNNTLNESKQNQEKAQNQAAQDGQTSEVTNGNADENPLAKSTEAVNTEVVKPIETKANELAALMKKRGEGAAKISRDLRKRTQQLLDKQIKQMKMLLIKFEQPNMLPAQKATILKTIKALQLCIENTKKELTNEKADESNVMNALNKMTIGAKRKSSMVLPPGKKVPKSKEEAQKEILDAELDLFTRQQEGQDVTELEKRIHELRRAQMFRPGIVGGRRLLPQSYRLIRKKTGGAASRTKFTKGGLKTRFVNQTVDHRPRAILVSGYESDEQDQVIQHFAKFGEIVEKDIDSSTPSVTLQYKARKEAEMAFSKGKQFNDRTLSITWVAQQMGRMPYPPGSPPTQPEQRTHSPTFASNMDEIDYEPSFEEDILLQDDEEEDEENEDRSWRR